MDVAGHDALFVVGEHVNQIFEIKNDSVMARTI